MTDLRAKGLREVAEQSEQVGNVIDDQTWYLAQFEGWGAEGGGGMNAIVRDCNAAVTQLKEKAARRPLVAAFSGTCSPSCPCSNTFAAQGGETEKEGTANTKGEERGIEAERETKPTEGRKMTGRNGKVRRRNGPTCCRSPLPMASWPT